jgi:predicted NAD-dependent protein-ADP-ribosyltransferase YbiA (DUF1768 family)
VGRFGAAEAGVQDLSHLEDMFTEEEVLAVVQELAAEKAPGLDEFVGLFLKHSWGTIKLDIVKAFEFFHQQHDQHLRLLNTAHLVLIQKNLMHKKLLIIGPLVCHTLSPSSFPNA